MLELGERGRRAIQCFRVSATSVGSVGCRARAPLSTPRFRSLLGRHGGIDPQHIHAHVIGEHGDSEVLTWSLVTVAGMPLESFTKLRGMNLTEEKRQEIERQAREAAYTIISGKAATFYGIGSALARIVNVILHDQRAMMTVCLPTPEIAGVTNVTLSLPRLVGGDRSA